MAYTVLARKYRSQTFAEVIGQAPIATTLANSIKAGRIHHGYLFTGTRGTGKTSMARILAKSLNCLKSDGPTVTPCLECESCRLIAEGQDLDVLEIDAASNTGVDNIRELRSNAAFRPARARFKIYIIDEVHMLSTQAFNALLKTLEEPPEHVKFILATTELQKVPATIQSRCQRFNFRNIGVDDIAGRLESIVTDEGAKPDAAVLRRIARLAGGSMRDALSILDQLLAVSPKKLSPEALDELLPPAQDEQGRQLMQRVADGDVPAALQLVEEIVSAGRGLDAFVTDLIEVVRTLLVLRTCGADSAMVDVPAATREDFASLAQRFELSHYVQMIAMLEELRRTVRHSSAGRAILDAVIVRMARITQWAAIETILAGLPPGDDAEKKKQPGTNAVEPARLTSASHAPVVSPARPLPEPAVSRRAALADEGPAPNIARAGPHAPQTPARPAASAAGAALPAEPAPIRARVLRDPLVKQVIDLFNGDLADIAAGEVSRPGPSDEPEGEAAEA